MWWYELKCFIRESIVTIVIWTIKKIERYKNRCLSTQLRTLADRYDPEIDKMDSKMDQDKLIDEVDDMIKIMVRTIKDFKSGIHAPDETINSLVMDAKNIINTLTSSSLNEVHPNYNIAKMLETNMVNEMLQSLERKE